MLNGYFCKANKIILSKIEVLRVQNPKINEQVLPFVALSCSADMTQRICHYVTPHMLFSRLYLVDYD